MSVSETKKVAFITGGNRGLGFETARILGEHGVIVIIGARDPVQGEAAALKLRDSGFACEALPFDLSKKGDGETAYEFFEKRFGRLDILINNAGVSPETVGVERKMSTVCTVTPQMLRETFETNFFSTISLTLTLLPLIKKSPAGRIVNVSSMLASLALHQDPNSPVYIHKPFAYDASKTALNAFTVHLAYELRETPIKVNSAHPGWVQTEMGGSEAPMTLADGGKTSAQLALLDADGPTGAYIHLGKPLPW
jgi:NAD(P)-dependent dehydrogenase (short-subunit alcohol dehydrogenase family)